MTTITNVNEMIDLCNVVPFDNDISLNEINAANAICVHFNISQLPQFNAAFSEFLRNGELEINVETGDIVSTFVDDEDNEGYEPFSTVEYIDEENIMEIFDVNGYWHAYYMPFYDLESHKFKGATFFLEFDQNTHGFWTVPGVQIHRCLGQSLQVSIIDSVSSDNLD